MGLGQTQKQEFNMELIYTTKQKGQLMQVGCKWCDGLNRDNFNLKFYTARNL